MTTGVSSILYFGQNYGGFQICTFRGVVDYLIGKCDSEVGEGEGAKLKGNLGWNDNTLIGNRGIF